MMNELIDNRAGRRAPLLLLMLVALLLSACGGRQPNLSLLPPDTLYAEAAQAYEAGQYDRAITLLEYFVARNLGDPRAPAARMMLGEAHFARREYAVAATHFQHLIADFPSDPRALQARFLICESYERLSPRPALDQEYTVSALLYCESVAENYPGTPEGSQAQGYVDELRTKLARKEYENGVFYFKRRAYDSAAVYFEAVVARYPETEVAPAALSRLVETYDRIGYVEDAQEARERLLERYPLSAEAQALRE